MIRAATILMIFITTSMSFAQYPGGSQILFSRLDNQGCLFLLDVDKPDLSNALIDSACGKYFASWSPDGQRVVYMGINGLSDRQFPNTDVYTMGAYNTNVLNLTQKQGSDIDRPLSWSPDEMLILFESNLNWYNGRYGEHDFTNLFMMNTDGTNIQQLTFAAGKTSRPSWSPDSRYIVFDAPTHIQAKYQNPPPGVSQYSFDDQEIYLVDLNTLPIDAESLLPLTENETGDYSPLWSPNGQQIAYLAQEEASTVVKLMAFAQINQDSTAETLIQFEGIHNYYDFDWSYGGDMMSWSPDDSSLAVVGVEDGTYDIQVLDLQCAAESEGCQGKFQNLTHHPANDWCPSWSPDDQRIAFLSDRDGNREVYVMGIDGENVQNVTNTPQDETCPLWRPMVCVEGVQVCPKLND